jgi:AraC-like DNA-binding protein
MGSPEEFLWDVVSPARRVRTPGVSMAGFADRGRTPPGLRLVPHPAVTVALMFGPSEVVMVDAAGGERRGSIAAGLGWHGAVGMRRAAGMRCLQVRLSPVVARAILGVGPGELGDELTSPDDLWGREVAALGERLSDEAGWDGRFALTDAWLARRYATARKRIDREVGWAWRRIYASRGLIRVEAVADEVGWSRKRLWARFTDQIGLPPKQAARLVRFDRAAHRLAEGQAAARVSADCGYADQSHLHRDVMAFTGSTPVEVAREPFLAVDDVAWPGHL